MEEERSEFYAKETLTEMAGELGQAIKLSREFFDYQAAKAVFIADEELQDLIKKFNLEKLAVSNEMGKDDDVRDENQLKSHQTAMRSLYAEIQKFDTMAKYNEAKFKLEGMVNDIYGVINYYVTGKEPGSCTGSCETCSGCNE